MPNNSGCTIERLADGGDGVLDDPRAPGGPRYIQGAVPGDLVRSLGNGRFAIEPTPLSQRRATMLCPHFPGCGGCSAQHMSDALYGTWKASRLANSLKRAGILDDGDPRWRPLYRVGLHSRRRAVLTARIEDGAWRLGFHEARSHRLVDIRSCAVLTPGIVGALDGLEAVARLVGQGAECRLSILDVGRGLDVAVETGRRGRIRPEAASFESLAKSMGMLRLTVDGDMIHMLARPSLAIAGIAVVPPPGAFVQAAADAEAVMTGIACDAISQSKARKVADLYSGLGTFTLAIAKQARVLAIDSEPTLLHALQDAIRHASALKPVETRRRDLFRDPLSPRELDAFDAVVFDPPRAGAKAQAETIARSKVRTVLAVSCNPSTFARDAATLIDGGYRLDSVTPIDQFLFTPHLEVVAVLRRP